MIKIDHFMSDIRVFYNLPFTVKSWQHPAAWRQPINSAKSLPQVWIEPA